MELGPSIRGGWDSDRAERERGLAVAPGGARRSPDHGAGNAGRPQLNVCSCTRQG